MKILQHNIGDELTQKHDYIDANQEFIANPWRSQPSLPHLIIGMETRVLGTLSLN
jgi:ubiquinone biosynthesis protein Coq4